jgi:Flp pilus assembly protein TadG
MQTIRSILKRFSKSTKGTTAIEYALILPAFLLCTVGAIDIGYAMYGRIVLEYATSQTARYAFVNAGTTTASQIRTFGLSLVPANTAYTTYNFSASITPLVSTTVTGTLTYTFIFLPISPLNLSVQIVQPHTLA